MTQREHPHLVALHDEAVQRDVSRRSIGNDQFTKVCLDAPADERMRREIPNGAANRFHHRDGGIWIFGSQVLDRPLDLLQRAR